MSQVSQPGGLRLLLPERLMLLAFGPWNGRLRVGLRPYLEAALASAVARVWTAGPAVGQSGVPGLLLPDP
jgi:hypothetical protein